MTGLLKRVASRRPFLRALKGSDGIVRSCLTPSKTFADQILATEPLIAGPTEAGLVARAVPVIAVAAPFLAPRKAQPSGRRGHTELIASSPPSAPLRQAQTGLMRPTPIQRLDRFLGAIRMLPGRLTKVLRGPQRPLKCSPPCPFASPQSAAQVGIQVPERLAEMAAFARRLGQLLSVRVRPAAPKTTALAP